MIMWVDYKWSLNGLKWVSLSDVLLENDIIKYLKKHDLLVSGGMDDYRKE